MRPSKEMLPIGTALAAAATGCDCAMTAGRLLPVRCQNVRLAMARAVAGFKSAFAGARLIYLDEKQNFLLLTQSSLNFSVYGAC